MYRRAFVAALAVLVTGVLAHAGDTLEAKGKVTEVSRNTLTIDGTDGEWTFEVSSETVVKAKGATHKMRDLEARGKPSVLEEFVEADQTVTIQYRKADGKTWADEIRVH